MNRNHNINCEIEFLPVGEESKAGDAIIIRYGTEHDYKLMLVDGGHAATGDLIVEHVKKYFPGHGFEHVVLTHCDLDHACGLRVVFESDLAIRNLWLNHPAVHAADLLPYFADKRFTADSLQARLFKEYDVVSDILRLAWKRKVTVSSAMYGAEIGPFLVLSPSLDMYRCLVPQFPDRTPAPDEAAIRAAGWWLGTPKGFFSKLAAQARKWLRATWDSENLRDGGQTGASNESSVVLYGRFPRPVLLTSDAGICALNHAADNAEALGLPLRQFRLVQIPHHGSRSNVGPTVLNRLIGPPVPQGTPAAFSAYVSVPKDNTNHPRKIVLNAFMRRGARVIATAGDSILNYGGFAKRNGYSDVTAVPFSGVEEEYD